MIHDCPLRISICLLSSLFLLSCGSPQNKELASSSDKSSIQETDKFTSDEEKELNEQDTIWLDLANCQVKWEGRKIVKSHYGQINIDKGFLLGSFDHFSGGQFILNMGSIQVDDLEGEDQRKLEGKLKGKEFFQVEKYPMSTLTIVEVHQDSISADLEIMGKAKRISFLMDKSIVKDKLSIKSKFEIDRTDWGILYKSGTFLDLAADKAIDDKIAFEVELVTE